MYKFNNPYKHYRSKGFTSFLLIGAAIAVIVFFLPRNSGPQFRYDVGKPWMYSPLIAQFDFPIYKTDKAVKTEKDSIARHFEPYYNYDAAAGSIQIKRFVADYKNGIPGLPASYVKAVVRRLAEIYYIGIMESGEYSDISRDSTRTIRVVNGKKASTAGIKSVLSTISAYEMLFTDSTLSAQQQLLKRCDLNEYITPNLIYDEERSVTEMTDILSGVSLASGMVLSGQKIIDRGEIVDDYTFRVLNSFEKEAQRRSATVSAIPTTIAGQILFVAMLILILAAYIMLYRRDYMAKPRSLMMLYALITLFPVLVSTMISNNISNIYILPFAISPIFVRIFMDSRTAFISHVIMVLICAAAVKYQYEFIIIQLVAGLVAIYSLRELSLRAQLFRTSVLVTAAGCAVYFALQLMQDNSITTMDHTIYKYFIINGVLLLFAYPLMLIIEKMFGFISSVTLIELSNTSKELLRQLSEIAPGTFQHSVMVSNLGAEIAIKIGANAQLVRTGALYHDIGKMKNAAYFTENQFNNNPLDKMSRIEAAQIVISHVTEGLRLADKHNLPSVIKEFINTHHGTGMAKYFYVSYKNEHPDEPVDDSLFTYPGADPFTREQAVLMMADTVEAASRSLKEYTEESISELVNRLIDGQVAAGFFKYCPITFHNIAVAKQVLTERLKSVYHTRTSYPEPITAGKKGAEQAATK